MRPGRLNSNCYQIPTQDTPTDLQLCHTAKSSIFNGNIHHIKETMLSVWTLLSTAISAVSVSAISQVPVFHGQQLTLDLPERTQRLKFVSADKSAQFTIWENKTIYFLPSNPRKGHVSSVGKNWTFRIQRVTFDDEGSYILLNHSGAIIRSYIVKVKTYSKDINRIAGQTLTIRVALAGLKRRDAILHFYSNNSSLILVKNGVLVGWNHPDYINRLKVTRNNIQIFNVNTSDIGRYELTDRKGRLVSSNRMILVARRQYAAKKGLKALVLLLCIPGGLCFRYRKRISKRCRSTESDTNTGQPNTVPVSIPCSNTMSDPVGPGDTGQGYIAGYPPHPDQGQIHYPYPPESSGQPAVPPNPGFYPEYQNPVYPPAFGPGLPPAQPPQWNAPPTHYNPSAPVSQPSDRTSISMDILNSSDSGVKFDVNKGKSSGSNFL